MEMTLSFQVSWDTDEKAIYFTGPIRLMAGPTYDFPSCNAKFKDTLKKVSPGLEGP